MGLLSRRWFRVANDVLHDAAAAAWPGAVLVLWKVHRDAAATLAPDVLAALVRSWSWVLLLALLAAVIQLVTGIVRLNYHYVDVVPEAQPARGRWALVKHVVFVALFVYALVVAFMVLQA